VRLHAAALAAVAVLTPFSTFPKGSISSSASHEVPRLDRIVSTLAGVRATANCWTTRDWSRMLALVVRDGRERRLAGAAAFTNPEALQVQIGPEVCRTLAKILAGRPVDEVDEAFAAQVIAHESRHVAGVERESTAECEGMRTLPRAAELLGIPAARARRLAHVYRGTLYPSDQPAYRSASCRAALPGIVVENAFGPRTAVATLRARVNGVGAVLRWHAEPSPPPMRASRCPAVSRAAELARVEDRYARGPRIADVIAAVVRTPAAFRAGVTRVPSAFACYVGVVRRDLRRVDPKVAVIESRRRLGAHLGLFRMTIRSKRLPAVETGVIDLVSATDVTSRMVASIYFHSERPLPLAFERRAGLALERH
jgi:hypothetical protein